jgi:hypothetical protein
MQSKANRIWILVFLGITAVSRVGADVPGHCPGRGQLDTGMLSFSRRSRGLWHPFRVQAFFDLFRWCRALRALDHRLRFWQASGLLKGRVMTFAEVSFGAGIGNGVASASGFPSSCGGRRLGTRKT